MLRYTFGNIDGKVYGLNANEMSVYEAIGKCSRKDNARGWFSDMQTLAEQLPHKIGRMTVSRAVDKLITLGLIRRCENSLFTCAQNEHANAQNEHANAQNEQANAQNEQNIYPPYNPPINNNNEMEMNNTRTCAQARNTANPKPSFIDLKDLFIEKGGVVFSTHAESAEFKWNESTMAKKKKLLEAVRSGSFIRSRIDWLVADFKEPEPEFLKGDEDVPVIVQVRYRDLYKLCTPEVADLFCLPIVKRWK